MRFLSSFDKQIQLDGSPEIPQSDNGREFRGAVFCFSRPPMKLSMVDLIHMYKTTALIVNQGQCTLLSNLYLTGDLQQAIDLVELENVIPDTLAAQVATITLANTASTTIGTIISAPYTCKSPALIVAADALKVG